MAKALRYMADFETTTDPEDCHVWAYALLSMDSDKLLTGTTLESFMHTISRDLRNPTIYFHNLRFDGEFILSWLFQNGFTWVKKRSDLQAKTFTTLIADSGAFYSMEIMFRRTKTHSVKASFLDSLKLLPFSVAEIAKGFKLERQKGSIDYTLPRPLGYEPTPEEWSYIENDVRIVAAALHVLFLEGLTKMTIGSNALGNFKETMGRKFDVYFPIPHYDADIRQSYKGGFTYLNPRYANRQLGEGIVLDVNSLYPSVMRYDPMPYGEPIYFSGEYVPEDLYNLYIVMLTCNFTLKKDHIPTIQLKGNLSFVPTEYIVSSNGEDVTLVLTSVDYALFMDHYDVTNIVYEGGYKFKSSTGMFDEYIDKWSARKISAKEEGNHAVYILSKLMLNNLYGKFSLNPKTSSKVPYYEEEIVKYTYSEPEVRPPVYLPVGTFITAYAREKTIRSAQKLYDRFIYADTDSLHLVGTEVPDVLEVHDTDLGKWKHEGTFKRAKFLRAKTYIEVVAEPGSTEYRTKITCAGMPKTCYDQVDFGNFKPGSSYSGKLVPRHVKGGVVLKNIDFTIASDKIKGEG